MATETATEHTSEPDSRTRTPTRIFIESLAVMGLFGSFFVMYALGIVVADATVGEELATGPAWFVTALNATVSIPVLTGMVVVAGWVVAVVRDERPEWETLFMHGAAGAVVLSPVVTWVSGVL